MTVHRVIPVEVVATLMAPVELMRMLMFQVPEKAVPILTPSAFPFLATMLNQ
jgi:hypothetical protein